MASVRYKAALIGCGGIGYLYDRDRREGAGALTHFAALEDSAEFDLVAVCDVSPGVLAEIEARHGKKTCLDFQEMLIREQPLDVVVVATPDDTHEAIFDRLVAFQPRLVVGEKPLALSRAGLDRLVARYREAGIGLAVNFYRRYTKALQDLKELLVAGELGAVHTVTVYYSRGFFHNCCHFIDLLDWYFGRPQAVRTLNERPGLTAGDPTRSLLLHYPGGLEAYLIGLPASRLLTYEVDILADRGRARVLHQGTLQLYRTAPNRTWQDFSQYELAEERAIDFAGAMPAMYANIAAWLDGREALLSPGENGSLVFEIADMAEE